MLQQAGCVTSICEGNVPFRRSSRERHKENCCEMQTMFMFLFIRCAIWALELHREEERESRGERIKSRGEVKSVNHYLPSETVATAYAHLCVRAGVRVYVCVCRQLWLIHVSSDDQWKQSLWLNLKKRSNWGSFLWVTQGRMAIKREVGEVLKVD